MLTACSAASVAPVQIQNPLQNQQVLTQIPALERQGGFAAVLALAQRVPAPHSLALQVAEVRALWLAGRAAEAEGLENAWLGRVRLDVPADARLLLDHARWHAGRKAWAAAWHVLAPLQVDGCRDAVVCQLTASVLQAWHPPELPALAFAAAPALNRAPWLIALAQHLADGALLAEARQVLDFAHLHQPSDLALWAAWLLPDRKVPPPDARNAWLQAVDKQAFTADQLLELAQTELIDRFTAARLAQLAAQRPDAQEAHWQALAMALLRADDADGLHALATAQAQHFQMPRGQLILARALLAAKKPALAQPLVAALPPDDAWTQLLQSEILRQTGQLANAVALRTLALQKAADRSEMALVAAQLLKKTGDSPEPLLATAMNQPGLGQLPALRMRALDALGAPLKVSPRELALRVAQYASALTREVPAATPLTDEWPPPPARAREQLARQLENLQPRWADAYFAVLRIFADAQVAAPWMLRELALKVLRDDDADGFAALDAKARANAAAAGQVLGDERVLNELGNRPSPVLARWLRDSGVVEASTPAAAWKVVNALIRGPFAYLGRVWAEHALRNGQAPELSIALLTTLTAGGAADLTLELLAKRTPLEPVQELPWLIAEANALLALDSVDDAEAKLKALVLRPDLPARQIRPAVDLAWEHGLCEVVLLAVPRMLAERDDLYSWRTGVQRGLDCARRHERPEWMELVIQSSKAAQPDPVRVEGLGRELANFGFNERAAATFDAAEKMRGMAPDGLSQWAHALLQLGRVAEASDVLNRATLAMRGRASLLHQRAADMLEEFGEFAVATPFWAGATHIEPDNPMPRYRLVANRLRQGQTAGVAEDVLALFRAGPGTEILDQLQALAVKTGQVQLVYDALATVADADRDTERVRMNLAAKLGLRDAVAAGVRRLRAKRSAQSAQVPQWLLAVGDRRLAREVAEDVLASADPTSAPQERPQTLRLALAERRDPTSDAEALSLTRFYVGRALDGQRAAMEAAVELARAGLAEPARAVATLANPGDHPLRTCMLATFEHEAGNHGKAMELWRKSMAAALLDTRLRDYLRMGVAQTREGDGDEVALELQCVLAGLTESHEYTMLASWLTDLLAMAPDSSSLRARLFHVQLLRGDVPAAIAELRVAAQVLTELKEADWQRPCERLLRDGGGPLLLTWLLEQGDALRTEPWFLAFSAAVLASQTADAPENNTDSAQIQAPLTGGPGAPVHEVASGPLPPPDAPNVRAALRALAPALPALRMELALQWTSRGRTGDAIAVLGRAPLSVADGQLADAVKAVAATAVSLVAQGDPLPKLRGWLARGRGVDTQSAVAQDLVRQGQLPLAFALFPLPQDVAQPAQLHANTPTQKRRALVALAVPDDAVLAAQWQRAIRGQRAALETGDEAVAALLRAGRVQAAGLLAQAIHDTEPGMQPLPLADAVSPVQRDAPGVLALARAFRPEALQQLRSNPAEFNEETAEALLQIAVAADPAQALRWTRLRARADQEPWRVWQQLLEAAEDFAERDLARTALQQATALGAPAGVQACPRLWLERTGKLADCLRGRSADSLRADELADVAAALALGGDPTETTDFFQRLSGAQHQTQGQFLIAAAGRMWALAPPELDHLRALLRQWLAALPVPERESLIVVQLDELAALGLGDLGVALEQRVWQRDPGARSERNNLAYAQFLAGAPREASLQLASQAALQTGGDAAYATLDTVASLRWALGDSAGALDAQLRALASVAAGPRDPEAGISLPLVRYAEFLLAHGDRAQARAIAALALQKPEEAMTGQRARRVLQAALRPQAR